ncbi:titin isoform X1 [Bombyx mori]|uniref:Uncharacterized protein n=1 Tax=Bombyx mori TaxID=7091 RepID=A0A8R2C722_BOMMO|nr:titin isoform X1 [Bombyx mori]XP_012547696.2 titin isoform X1 [Bombyx mori]XP_037873287.1 titin isoform X1 [Bombyx mori]
MAASGAPVRQPRRGPAPIASFDHDVSDEVRPPSSPETKQSFRLPEIREDPAGSPRVTGGESLAPPEQRARSHSTPAAGGLITPATPRIDISRASSSSHHDSRDSSPELALFAGNGGSEDGRAKLELGFREDGALDLRSSTEELAFLEGAPGEPRAPPPAVERRHSRKDSQSSEAALLAVSGRTSRLSSIGSQCSAHSALSGLSRTSRLSVVSGVSRSPSPHRMLLETSFCGPRPIENDPEICAAVVEEHLLEIAKMTVPPPTPVDARDHREIRTEATVEKTVIRSSPSSATVSLASTPVAITVSVSTVTATHTTTPKVIVPEEKPPIESTEPASVTSPLPTEEEKRRKETNNRARAEERRARPRLRREPSEPEVYKSKNRSKNIIRIKLKPDDEYEEEPGTELTLSYEPDKSSGDYKPAILEVDAGSSRAIRPTELVGRAPPSPAPHQRRSHRESRTPSPVGPPVSRKSSFCSLFKSRETIASPDSPSDALRRKRSLTDGRSRSKSRDRSATPTSASKIRGSVLSLFRTPRRSAASPSPSSREGSPIVHQQRPLATSLQMERTRPVERLKYYEDTRDGIIHIPLRTPPDERPSSSAARCNSDVEPKAIEATVHREPVRPASAPVARTLPDSVPGPARTPSKPIHRQVLPDGSIIIPLHSPTEKSYEIDYSTPISIELTQDAVAQHDTPVSTSNGISFTEDRDAADRSEASLTKEQSIEKVQISTPVDPKHVIDEGHRKRKERIVFTTHVGSREQVFSTQFSITKTPSVTSEISGSFPSFHDVEDTRLPTVKDVAPVTENGNCDEIPKPSGSSVTTPHDAVDAPRDSSESEPSSETAPPQGGSEVERRGLVVQESFEEELPYVPTTLPMERPVALPMIPVRERAGVHVSAVERPRAAPPPTPRPRMPPPPPVPARDPPPADKLRIRLPRRSRTVSAAPTARISRPRTRSGGDGTDLRPKEWIDFEDVPERRKQPKRIQTLPAGAVATTPSEETPGSTGGLVFSYVEPEHCRCECHGHARADDQLPLLHDQQQTTEISTSPVDHEAQVGLSLQMAPFDVVLDLHREQNLNRETPSGSIRQ